MKKALIPLLLLVISLLVSSVTSVLARPQKPEPIISDEVSAQIETGKQQQSPTIVENPTPPPAEPTPAPTKTTPKSTTKKPIIKPKVVTPAPAMEAINCTTGSFNSQFLCLLNEYRKSKGLNALSYEAALNATALDHSTWMMNDNKSISHIGLNGSTFDQRCVTHLTTCDAENLAWGTSYTTSALALFNAWKNSPGHNANMLGAHTKTGLGLAGVYATSLFR